MDENTQNGKGYVDDDVHGRPFVWFAVVFTIFCVVSVAAVTFTYRALEKWHTDNQGDAPTKIQTGSIVPPEPQLQADPVVDLKAMDKAQTALLEGYAWVDKENGIARIPIDKAIEITLERSLVKAQAPAAASPAPAATASNQEQKHN